VGRSTHDRPTLAGVVRDRAGAIVWPTDHK